MTIVIDDKFSGESAEIDLDAHTPDTVGTGWTIIEQTGGRDLRISGDIGAEELSGEAQNSVRSLYTAQGTYTVNDYDVEIDVTAADTGDDVAWLLGRVTDSSNYYGAGFVVTAGTDLWLVKNVAATVTDIASADADWAASATIKLEIRDAAKKVFVDDVEKISDADDALTSVGEAGVALGNIRAADDDMGAAWRMDNFLVTDTAGAGGSVTEQAVAAIAVGIVAIGPNTVFKTLADAAVGLTKLGKIIFKPSSLDRAATGIPTLTTTKFIEKIIAATATGVVTLGRGIFKTLAITAIGTVTLNKAIFKTLSAIAAGIAAIAAVVPSATPFSGGAGLGILDKTQTRWKRRQATWRARR